MLRTHSLSSRIREPTIKRRSNIYARRKGRVEVSCERLALFKETPITPTYCLGRQVVSPAYTCCGSRVGE